MRRFVWILAAALLLCAGCGTEAALPENPAAPVEAESALADDHVIYSFGHFVDGRTLDIDLIGIGGEGQGSGVREIIIRWSDDKTPIQHIVLQEDMGNDSQYLEGAYTQAPDDYGGAETMDLDFDGVQDLVLTVRDADLENPWEDGLCACWLWDRQTEQFCYAFCLQNPDTDQMRTEILSRRFGQDGGNRTLDAAGYRLEDGALCPLWERSTNPQSGQTQFHLWQDGEKRLVRETLDEGDHVLSVREVTVDGGHRLRLEAVGMESLTDYGTSECGVREVRVYDGGTLVQIIPAQEAIDTDGVDGMVGSGYTDCWTRDEVMSVADMNFDGSDDFGLFGWQCNNTIPYYYWLWDSDIGAYRYAFTLQGAIPHSETKEVSSASKSYGGDGPDGGYWHTDYYQYDAAGTLMPVRREVERYKGDTPVIDIYQMTGDQWVLADTKEVSHG